MFYIFLAGMNIKKVTHEGWPRGKYGNLPNFLLEVELQVFSNIQAISTLIIIIKKGRHCKAGREWYTPSHSEDPSPTIPTYRQKEEIGKNSRNYSRDRAT